MVNLNFLQVPAFNITLKNIEILFPERKKEKLLELKLNIENVTSLISDRNGMINIRFLSVKKHHMIFSTLLVN